MPTALGPRFVLEAGFLVLLALVVGLADLDPLLIVVVMLVGWILVSLIEYFAWRQTQSALMRRFEPAVAGATIDEAVVDDEPPPLPPPPPEPEPPAPEPEPAQPPEEDTMVEPVAEEPQAQPETAADEPPVAAEEGTTGIADAEERRVAHRLEPLQPRPRRRWIFFGPHERPDESAEDDSEA